MARIWQMPAERPNTRIAMQEANEEKLIELHFYFVSIRNIYRFLSKAIDDDVLSEFSAELDTLNSKWLAHNSKAREAFEHIDQRLPGEKHEEKIAQIGNRKVHYGISWKDAEFRHSDLVWDISQNTYEEFHRDIAEFLNKLQMKFPKEWRVGV
ncbi:MAG: hypothetical protein JJ957_20355 [Pseudomonadales bacterium]|nr:hypothetical protein [Pseudomonadales bacterium]